VATNNPTESKWTLAARPEGLSMSAADSMPARKVSLVPPGMDRSWEIGENSADEPPPERQVGICRCGDGAEVFIRDAAFGIPEAAALLASVGDWLGRLGVRLNRLKVNGEIIWERAVPQYVQAESPDQQMTLNKVY
jgi:hypothetical protein